MSAKNSKKRRTPAVDDGHNAADVPDVGKIIERLRSERGISVRDLAEHSGLSPSFIRAVERGDSDISLGRLARLANVFHHDLGSFLGFTSKLSRPTFITGTDRKAVNRGRGVQYEALHLPALDLDLVIVELEPEASFKDELSHEGIDVVYVTEGELVLIFNGTDYPMTAGDCCVFSAVYPHKLRNDSKRRGAAISVTTGRM